MLPTKPVTKGAWARAFPDEVERKSLVNLLGNLALLTPAANSSAGNVGFSKKKGKYQRLLGAGMPRITADVVAADECTHYVQLSMHVGGPAPGEKHCVSRVTPLTRTLNIRRKPARGSSERGANRARGTRRPVAIVP